MDVMVVVRVVVKLGLEVIVVVVVVMDLVSVVGDFGGCVIVGLCWWLLCVLFEEFIW